MSARLTCDVRQDEIYRTVGEEVARKEYHLGPLARAVAEAQGNRDLVQSLYIRFRHEELALEIERDEISQERSRQQTIADDPKNGIYTFPKCGYRGELVKKRRGSMLVGVVIFLLTMGVFIIIAASLGFKPERLKFWLGMVPFILYILIYHGHKGVCSKCGATLEPRIQ